MTEDPAAEEAALRPATAGVGSRAVRNTALVLAARILSRAIALVTVLATLNHLGPAGFGRFQTLVTYTSVITVLVDLGFNTLYVREAARHPGEIARYLSNLVTTRLLMSLLGLAVLALALRIPGLQSLLLPGFLLMILASLSQLLRQTFYALQRVGFDAVETVLEAAVLLGLTLLGIFGRQGVAYFVWAYALSYAFACAFILTVLVVRRMAVLRPRFEPRLVATWLVASLPLALTFVVTTLYFKIDVPILQLFRSFDEVGWYASAYKPFEALLFVPMAMLNVIFPLLSVYHREDPDRLALAIDRFYKLLLLVGWPLTVGVLVLAPGLTRLLRLYPQAEPALAVLALGIVFMFVNNTWIGTLNAIDRQAAFTWAALASLVVNVALNLALIPTYGYLGAAWATVLTEAVLFTAGLLMTRHYLRLVPVARLSWRVLLAGLLMGAVLLPFRGFAGGWATLGLVVLGGLLYGGAALLLRALDQGEMEMLRRAAGR
ncbi:MAG TPA: flippase [Candidatus Dormibacteraeota bacterium]